jgi:starch synthase
MDILFVATEIAPYVKVGGLADVVAALTKTLRQLGHKVTVAMPRFPAFERGGLLVARRLTPLSFEMGGEAIDVTVYDGRLATGVELVLLDAPGLFDRDGVYGEAGEDYADNARRFGILSRAAVELCRQRAAAGSPFDVVHTHDWPTALVSMWLRLVAEETGASLPPSVLTIHNLAHQGVLPKKALAMLGLPERLFHPDGLEFYGKLNLLKGGLLAAHKLTTVSTTYANEIQTDARGEGLDGVLSARAADLVGIVNGIDYSVWNPATDAALPARYDAEDASFKARCRGAIVRDLELDLSDDRPLAIAVGRIVHQKGTDLVAAALAKIVRTGTAVVIAGDGDPDLVAKVETAVGKQRGQAAFVRAASEDMVHRLFAAADLALVPSRFEPCGLVQLYAQRYGALPVAHATGGLCDTVVDCDAQLETGTGFLFGDPTSTALVGAVQRAVAAFTSPRWPELRRRVMRLDLAWDRPARRYEQLYRSAMSS